MISSQSIFTLNDISQHLLPGELAAAARERSQRHQSYLQRPRGGRKVRADRSGERLCFPPTKAEPNSTLCSCSSAPNECGMSATSKNNGLPDSRDLDATWKFLEDGVDHIMTRLSEGMSYQKYMNLYTVSYNYCTSSRMNTATGGDAGSRSGANLMGADLYRHLNEYFVAHLAQTRKGVADLSEEGLLSYYTKEWHRFTTGASYVNRLFTYLNRHWVKREKDEGRKNVYGVYILALVQWRDHLYKQVQKQDVLTRAALKLIEKQRNGETIETDLVQRAIESFVALGLDDLDANRQNLEVYREAFEKPFLQDTEIYYKSESDRFIASNSVTEYMKKAEARLLEEENRVDLYLHASTKKALVSKCEEVLVANHASVLQDEFQRLLDQEEEADLQRMYSLLSRVQNGLDPLRERFEQHVKKAGFNSVEKTVGSGDDAAVDPKAYVDSLLAVHKKNLELVNKAFKGDQGFVASLDKACREFVNRNKACPSANKSPELLAKYADALLRKSNKASEDADMEQALTDTMVVFKYIEDKDVFQKFYSKNLAKRLVYFSSASDDAEANMISRLKDACGFEYTSKLQRMFQDMALNKDLNDTYREKMAAAHEPSELAVDFHILVLGTAAWPLNASPSQLQLPTELRKVHERFERYYMNKHSGRKLQWLWHLSRNELRSLYTPNKYIFAASTFQTCILLQFNGSSDSLSYNELETGTGIAADTLKPILALMTKQKVIELKDDNYELNLGFKSKKIRVNINMPVKSEAKAESADVMKHVDEDRKLLIQAVIVRIMKSRKTMKHQPLIAEAVDQLKSRFTPRVQDVKRAIDTLLDKEYIERVEGQRDTFSYLA